MPRKGEGEGKRSEYQNYLKMENGRVRLENPGKGFGEIMVILAREFRESQRRAAIVGNLEQETKANTKEGLVESGNLNDIARQLDLLNLKA